jgi:hypothetical protein
MNSRLLLLAIAASTLVSACSVPSASTTIVDLRPISPDDISQMYDDGRLKTLTGTDGVTVEFSLGKKRPSIQPALDAARLDKVNWCLHPDGYVFPAGNYPNRLTSQDGKVRVNDSCEVV